jgi:hypothetical protein
MRAEEGSMTIRRLAVLAALAVLLSAGALSPALRSSAVSAASAPQADAAELVLTNEYVRAVFLSRGVRTLLDRKSGAKAVFGDESARITVNGRTIDLGAAHPYKLSIAKDKLTFSQTTAGFRVRIVYELRPGWRFLSKQIFLEPAAGGDFRVEEVRGWESTLETAPESRLPLSDGRFGTILRYPGYSLLALYQNPYNEITGDGAAMSAAYKPAMDWKPAYGAFATDRFLLGIAPRSGRSIPARSVPEWKWVPDYAAYLAANPVLDEAESEALVECVRAFLLYRPTKSIRVHVPWCENDYQIDVATAEGMAEYKRIIDRAAELGATHTLYTPADGRFSSLAENRDAWGWENLLFFSLGQKIRKGEWVPGRDPAPPAIREAVAYARSRGLGLLAYAYPSLPFLQDPAWTRWAGDKLSGTNAVDTGQRGFQDWWIGTLTGFVRATGAAGFSFDHWWIAYDDPKATSKYAQWFGARRILEELRRRVPDIVMDGRQQYMNFGPWTWLAGSYPHPTLTDEQPESFTAFPDLHTDRVSADRQRFAAWKYRVERFAPPEIMPGYITHQTERTDEKGVMRRDRFRPRDWDRLGWTYSLLSSVATAPFNHTLSFVPARDEEEFKALPEVDKAFFRGWLDWTDANAETLRRVRPIIGPPMIGRCDGTAAIRDGRGFVFLFNPNYRRIDASFRLDASIGLERGGRFLLRELHPEAGRLIGKPSQGFWNAGDEVVLPMRSSGAMVLELLPAPAAVREPLLFGAPGRAVLQGELLEIDKASGEPGTERELQVILPAGTAVSALVVNGKVRPNAAGLAKDSAVRLITVPVRFAGRAFGRGEPAVAFDPAFAGGTARGSFRIPIRIFDQLRARRASWPVTYTEDDLLATWLGSHRLLLFVQIAEPDEAMDVKLRIDGKPVPLTKAYNSIYGHSSKRTFLGFYADVSSLQPDRDYAIEVDVPVLGAGRFQGVFFENVEPEWTTEIVL